MSGPMRQMVRMPLISLGSTLVWGVVELLALHRARRAPQDRRTPGSGNAVGTHNPPMRRAAPSSTCKR